MRFTCNFAEESISNYKEQLDMKKLVISLTMLFLIAFNSIAEVIPSGAFEAGTSSVKGKVLDKTTGSPLEYVQVAVFNKADSSLITGSLTDSTGSFMIKKVPYGNYFITAEFMGYNKYIIKNLNLSAGNPLFVVDDILLEVNAKELGQVDVVSTTDAMSIRADKKVLNVDKNLTAKGGTAIEALKGSPSITIDQEGEVLLRGSKSFKVLVNGKPTAMKPNDALKQIPAGRIDKIELITNPSAKFDAEGTAGIINIITKKGMGAGSSALINASAGTGDKYNADINLNYSTDKFNLTIGGKWKDSKQFYDMDEILRTTNNGLVRNNDVIFYRHQTDRNLGGNLTLEYNLNDNNSISYSFDGGYTKLYIDANFKYDETLENQTNHTYVYEDLHLKLFANYFTNNLSFTHKFDNNSEWTTSGFYSHIDYYFENNQDRFYTGSDFSYQNVSPYYTLRFDNENFSTEYRLKTDYTKNLEKGGKFETGAQFHGYRRYLDLYAENYDYNNSDWVANTVFTNELDFDEKIMSAYVNFSGEKFGIDYSVGYRLEYADRLIESFTLNEKYKYQKIHPFLSASFSKKIGKSNTLALNFSSRIDRPDEYFLNPFPDVSNEYQTAYGNPLLRPNITESYEFSYQRRFEKGMFSSQAYARVTNDAYTQVIGSDENGIMVLTFDNISDDKEFGIENMVNIQAAKWYSLNASFNVMGQYSKGIMNDDNFERSAITFNARMINSFSLGKKTSAQLMAFYFHDQLGNAIGNVERFYWVDVAISRNFINDKLSVSLQAKDIFNTMHTKFDINRADYRFFVHRKPEYPVVLFNVSYKFNNYKGKKAVKTKLKI